MNEVEKVTPNYWLLLVTKAVNQSDLNYFQQLDSFGKLIIMTTSGEFELTPEQKKREQEVFIHFSQLLETQRSRYEAQAKILIEQKGLETTVDGFRLSYVVKENSYLCQLHNLDKSGKSYEIEFPIPDSDFDKLETLIELFAQSEAGRIG